MLKQCLTAPARQCGRKCWKRHVAESLLNLAIVFRCMSTANSADCGSCEVSVCSQCSCPAGTYSSAGGPDGTGHLPCTPCPAGTFAREYKWTKSFDGECDGLELRMYNGGDTLNPGTSKVKKVSACARACLAKRTPTSGTWVRTFA